MMVEKALETGTVIKGGKHTYRIESLMRADGTGFTYRAVVTVGEGAKRREKFMVVREHMMPRCSSRGEDGMTVVTPDDIAPTVESCCEAFKYSSLERERIANSCQWLINVIETFSANNTYYYVVEYINGVTLVEYVESHGGKLTYEESRLVLSPIFDAVRILHINHVIHTDINPWHIRIIKTKTGLTPVLFSLYATVHYGDKGLQQWSIPAMNCEDGYAAPEQYRHVDHFCPQTDVYALAATLVYALSGVHLPDSRTITEQIIRDTLPEGYPEILVQAFINALHPDVSRRTTTITQFREELLQFTRTLYIPGTERDNDDSESEPGGFFSGLMSSLKNLFHKSVSKSREE